VHRAVKTTTTNDDDDEEEEEERRVVFIEPLSLYMRRSKKQL